MTDSEGIWTFDEKHQNVGSIYSRRGFWPPCFVSKQHVWFRNAKAMPAWRGLFCGVLMGWTIG